MLRSNRDALCAPNRVSLKQQLQGENGPILGDVHRIQGAPMMFRVGALALRTTESPQAITVLPKALAMDFAGPAGHRHFGFFCAHHS